MKVDLYEPKTTVSNSKSNTYFTMATKWFGL